MCSRLQILYSQPNASPKQKTVYCVTNMSFKDSQCFPFGHSGCLSRAAGSMLGSAKTFTKQEKKSTRTKAALVSQWKVDEIKNLLHFTATLPLLTFPLFAQHRWWVNQCFSTLLVSCVLIVRTLAISPWISPCAIILLNECPLINWKYFVFGCCSVAVSLSTNSMWLLVVCGPGWSCHVTPQPWINGNHHPDNLHKLRVLTFRSETDILWPDKGRVAFATDNLM